MIGCALWYRHRDTKVQYFCILQSVVCPLERSKWWCTTGKKGVSVYYSKCMTIRQWVISYQPCPWVTWQRFGRIIDSGQSLRSRDTSSIYGHRKNSHLLLTYTREYRGAWCLHVLYAGYSSDRGRCWRVV